MKSTSPTVPTGSRRKVIPFERGPARRADELAFLPAALEIVETPPSPTGRAIAMRWRWPPDSVEPRSPTTVS